MAILGPPQGSAIRMTWKFPRLRTWLKLAAALLLFGLLAIGEEYLRVKTAKPIPVEIAPGLAADGRAQRWPDFLWMGQAWYIEVISMEPAELEIDGRFQVRLPVGRTWIHSHHDVSNTADFGLESLRGPPSKITIRRTHQPTNH